MIWEWLTSTVRGPAGHRGQNVVPCVAEVHAPDIASVTHRPQVAQDVSVTGIRSNWPTATRIRVRSLTTFVVSITVYRLQLFR